MIQNPLSLLGWTVKTWQKVNDLMHGCKSFLMFLLFLLIQALEMSPHIHCFELQRSHVTDEQTKLLVRDGLYHMPHLRHLNLSYNDLGDAGITFFRSVYEKGQATNNASSVSPFN